eukprot:CAMPEP_0183369378 /NCGR_PEP_ID=MMETSP0164_2-20130417/99146_1 /TAXON_ID=221442 /ORGANISM="Coccolithus pelagicus ssp braarudi, Strain PLY182g" /LENGTH=98 /DNA_ID=CAMNT_0025545627 /DNA_START=104 /DNA_END=397 /DNA_ORIENTATION=+
MVFWKQLRERTVRFAVKLGKPGGQPVKVGNCRFSGTDLDMPYAIDLCHYLLLWVELAMRRDLDDRWARRLRMSTIAIIWQHKHAVVQPRSLEACNDRR